MPETDPWLERWLPLLDGRAAGLPILELGCGGGRDSEVLVAAGHRLVGVDRSAKAIANARKRAPSAEFHCQDIQLPWPVTRAGVIVIFGAARGISTQKTLPACNRERNPIG